MSSRVTSRVLWFAPALAALIAAAAGFPERAGAQGFFDFLFGPRYVRPAPPPWPGQPYARPDRDPFHFPPREREPLYAPAEPSAAYCVRLCDGRYFPLADAARATPARLCSALCPGSATKVFAGASIDTAIAGDGRSYADLPNAFLYRDKLVPRCTCNGKDPFGLARIDPEDDPTLQRGDIVAVDGRLRAYVGDRRGRVANGFAPLRSASGLSSRQRSQLEHMPVASD